MAHIDFLTSLMTLISTLIIGFCLCFKLFHLDPLQEIYKGDLQELVQKNYLHIQAQSFSSLTSPKFKGGFTWSQLKRNCELILIGQSAKPMRLRLGKPQPITARLRNISLKSRLSKNLPWELGNEREYISVILVISKNSIFLRPGIDEIAESAL